MTDTLNTYTAPLEDMELREVDDRHVLEGICVPYGRVTTKAGPRPEQFVAGAFRAAVETRATIKLVDYNHSRSRVAVGRSTLLEERPGGLWARFQLNRTHEGDGAFLNVREGVYTGLSIGFKPRREEVRSGVRTITDAHLDHVSLVEEPAYADAVVLDVRAAADPWADYRWILEPVHPTTIDIAPRESFTVLMARLRSR